MAGIFWIEVVSKVAIPLFFGILAFLLACCRFRVADRNRLEDQFKTGAERLGAASYSLRTAGAVTLADLALSEPGEYDERVMRAFQAFLDFPPRYGENHEKQDQVDYTSIDSLTILEAIEKREKKARERYAIRLTEGRPYRVNNEGNVERNPNYDDPAARTDELDRSAVERVTSWPQKR